MSIQELLLQINQILKYERKKIIDIYLELTLEILAL